MRRPWPDKIDEPEYNCCYKCYTGRHYEQCDDNLLCQCPCNEPENQPNTTFPK